MLEDLTIAIPSRSRWATQPTVKTLHPSLWERMVVFVPVHQVNEYREHIPRAIKIIGLEYKHIGEKRQRILQHTHTAKVIMMDDNLTFYKRTVNGESFRALHPSSIDTIEMIMQISKALDDYASIGLADKFMSQNRPRHLQDCQRFIHVLAYNLSRLPIPWPQFEICHYEDHHFHLQILERGHSTAILTEWSKMKTNVKGGGCSDWRTQELMDSAADYMLKRWPAVCIDNPERGADGARRLKFKWRQARHNGLYIARG